MAEDAPSAGFSLFRVYFFSLENNARMSRIALVAAPRQHIGRKAPYMSQAEDYAARLSEVIGARPAGTVEEQQAAFMIEGVFSEEIGLETDAEDFNCNPDFELPKTICAIATVVLGTLSLFLPLMVIPSIIITLVAAVIFGLEVIGNAPLSSSLKRGVSQNIIGKYVPPVPAGKQSGRQGRKRKVVIVAHYDTGKVRFELADPFFKALPFLAWVEVAAMALVPVLLLIRLASTATEGLLLFLNILIVVCIVVALVPVVFYILHQTAQFNVGANCNAAGVAAMLETARRIGVDFPAMAAEAEKAVLHGEDALLREGLVPEGAELSYETEIDEAADPASAEAGLVGSIASEEEGRSAETLDAVFLEGDTGEHGKQIMEGEAVAAATPVVAAPVMEAASVVQEPEEEDDPNVPEWYKAARKRANANKPESTAGSVSARRSKFADALDAAAEVSSNALHQMETTDAGLSPAEQRLQQMRQSILGNAEGANRSAVQPTAGVDGYLSSSTDAPTYESSLEEASTQAAMVEGQAASQRAEAVSARAEELAEDAEALATEAQDLEEALAREQANLEAQAKANRTISFIPVEVDPEDIFQQNESLKTGNIDQNAVAAQAAKPGSGSAKPGRRSISLPSLSGAIAPVKEARIQPAPLSDDAAAKTKSRRSRQEAISVTLPSTTDGPEDKANRGEGEKRSRVTRSAASSSSPTQEAAPVEGAAKRSSARNAAGSRAATSTAAKGTARKAESTSAASKESPARAAGERTVAATAAARTSARSASSAADKTTMMSPKKTASQIAAEAEMPARRTTQATHHRHAHVTAEDKARAARGEVIEDETAETLNENVSVAGSFISATETSSFKPVGDELIAHMDEEDIYVEDADDSDYADQVTQTGALAGPGYVSMPKGRMSRMLGRFRRKKDEEVSLKDTLGVDDSFDARSVGAARGGWESFRKDDELGSAWDEGDDWNGGAFTRKSPESESTNTRKRPKRGVSPFGNLPLSEEIVVEEREAVQQFKSGVLDTEVWFVGLGAELADNAGIKHFIRQHKDELRGSIVIDLDGLGAGTLTLIEEEGKVRRLKASARMKRYVNKAGSALGMRVESEKMNWRNSATYLIGKSGLPTIHLVGMEKGIPAHAGQADDTFENLSLETLEQNCDYLVELLRTI